MNKPMMNGGISLLTSLHHNC